MSRNANKLHGKTFIFLDGDLNGTCILRESVWADSSGGNLCTSADCFAQDIEAPRLEEGDFVVINNAGAYCQTTALWGFNSQPLFQEALLSADGTLTMLEGAAARLMMNLYQKC